MDASELAELGLTAEVQTMTDGRKTLVITATATGHVVAVRAAWCGTYAPKKWPTGSASVLHVFETGDVYGPGSLIPKHEATPE